MATQIESRIIDKALIKGNENYFDLTYSEMPTHYNDLISVIRDKRTHVLIASDFNIQLFIRQTDSYKHSTHISRHQYFDRPYGWVVHKSIAKTRLAIEYKNM